MEGRASNLAKLDWNRYDNSGKPADTRVDLYTNEMHSVDPFVIQSRLLWKRCLFESKDVFDIPQTGRNTCTYKVATGVYVYSGNKRRASQPATHIDQTPSRLLHVGCYQSFRWSEGRGPSTEAVDRTKFGHLGVVPRPKSRVTVVFTGLQSIRMSNASTRLPWSCRRRGGGARRCPVSCAKQMFESRRCRLLQLIA